MSAEVLKDRRYTTDHEWALSKDGDIIVGITAFAVSELGDITLVGVDVAVGDKIKEGATFGAVESVKTLSDLFSPVNGTIVAINEKLEDSPELVNENCWEDGWMIRIKPDNAADVDALLDAAAYSAHVEKESHH